jgi:hypothetical protein
MILRLDQNILWPEISFVLYIPVHSPRRQEITECHRLFWRAGSTGQAVIDLNRTDRQAQKFIFVEMNTYTLTSY